jgi:succinyl-CoA:acetate CoA-transferase
MTDTRIASKQLARKIMSAEQAAALIPPGANIGMSGFTGSGHPKSVPGALAKHIADARARSERFTVGVWTGAATAPELDGALAAVDGIDLLLSYQSDPVSRAKINAGQMDFLDLHLSHVAQRSRRASSGNSTSPWSRSPASPRTVRSSRHRR